MVNLLALRTNTERGWVLEGVNQSVISRRLRREGEVTPSRKYLHGIANRRHGSAGASPSRISLTLPKPYLGILVLGPDSDKSHFGSHPILEACTESARGFVFPIPE